MKITIIGHHLTRNQLEKGVSFERKVGATTEEEEEWNKISFDYELKKVNLKRSYKKASRTSNRNWLSVENYRSRVRILVID